jgi:hypothetical protein
MSETKKLQGKVRHRLPDLCSPPSSRLIFVNGRPNLDCRIDDPPRLLNVIFTGEQRLLARHGVGQHAFVCFHLVGTRVTARNHLRLLSRHLLD